MKKSISFLLAVAFTGAMLAGCAGGGASSSQSVQQESSSPVSVASTAKEGDSVLFTDSLGREVEIPKEPKRLAPSGPLSQIFLYTLCPDLIVGWSSNFSDKQKEFIEEKYWSLPTYGQLYGKNANLSMEELLAADPDLIIDVGEVKKGMTEDLDALQEQLGIPVIFIEASVDLLPKAYETAGGLFGVEKEAKVLSDYISKTLAHAKEVREGLKEEEMATVYYGLGQMGLEPNAEGSFHAQVLDIVGAVNVAKLEAGNADAVSMEQIMLWNPDVVVLDPGGPFDEVLVSPEWQTLVAVQAGRVYDVPIGPYNWMGRPPSVNQILGVNWLGSLLYPEQYTMDMVAETITFYELFYHVTITEETAAQLMENSIGRVNAA